MRLACLTSFVLACILPNAAAGAAATTWPIQYKDASTNRFIWDKRTPALVESKVHQPFAKSVLAALGGPPDPVVVLQERFFSASACVPHSCLEKGFFWLDMRSGEGLAAILIGHQSGPGSKLHLDSKTLRGELPARALQSIIEWVEETGLVPTEVDYVNASGISRSLLPADFQPQPRFNPPANGPSFDCALANSKVEHTICNDPALAAQDLKLAEFYRENLSGHDTLRARKQLTRLQHQWLGQRDAVCGQVAELKTCLTAQYEAQWMRLQTWTPAKPSPLLRRN